MLRHTEGVWGLWSFSVGETIVFVWRTVCAQCVTLCSLKKKQGHCVSAVQFLSSLTCLPVAFWSHRRSVWVSGNVLSLTNVYFLLSTHFVFSSFFLPLFPGFLSTSSKHSYVCFSTILFISFSPFLFLLAHPSLSSSVDVEVCSSLLLLSV